MEPTAPPIPNAAITSAWSPGPPPSRSLIRNGMSTSKRAHDHQDHQRRVEQRREEPRRPHHVGEALPHVGEGRAHGVLPRRRVGVRVGLTAHRRQRDERQGEQAQPGHRGGDRQRGTRRDRPDEHAGDAGTDRLADGGPDHALEAVDGHQVGLRHQRGDPRRVGGPVEREAHAGHERHGGEVPELGRVGDRQGGDQRDPRAARRWRRRAGSSSAGPGRPPRRPAGPAAARRRRPRSTRPRAGWRRRRSG